MDSIQKATLDFVNGLREALGLPTLAAMPAGSTYSAYSCPVATALSSSETGTAGACQDFVDFHDTTAFNKLTEAGVDIRHVYQGEDTYRVLAPPAVRAFVDAFDRGEYPELIA
jgi:hypothetical protein